MTEPTDTPERRPVAETYYLDPDSKKALADRLARLEGHVRAIRGMVLERRQADDILLQVSAVKAALNKFTSALLEHELRLCLGAEQEEAAERLERVTKVLTALLKQT